MSGSRRRCCRSPASRGPTRCSARRCAPPARCWGSTPASGPPSPRARRPPTGPCRPRGWPSCRSATPTSGPSCCRPSASPTSASPWSRPPARPGSCSRNGMDAEIVRKGHEGPDNVVDRIRAGDIDLVVNTPAGPGGQGGRLRHPDRRRGRRHPLHHHPLRPHRRRPGHRGPPGRRPDRPPPPGLARRPSRQAVRWVTARCGRDMTAVRELCEVLERRRVGAYHSPHAGRARDRRGGQAGAVRPPAGRGGPLVPAAAAVLDPPGRAPGGVRGHRRGHLRRRRGRHPGPVQAAPPRRGRRARAAGPAVRPARGAGRLPAGRRRLRHRPAVLPGHRAAGAALPGRLRDRGGHLRPPARRHGGQAARPQPDRDHRRRVGGAARAGHRPPGRPARPHRGGQGLRLRPHADAGRGQPGWPPPPACPARSRSRSRWPAAPASASPACCRSARGSRPGWPGRAWRGRCSTAAPSPGPSWAIPELEPSR